MTCVVGILAKKSWQDWHIDLVFWYASINASLATLQKPSVRHFKSNASFVFSKWLCSANIPCVRRRNTELCRHCVISGDRSWCQPCLSWQHSGWVSATACHVCLRFVRFMCVCFIHVAWANVEKVYDIIICEFQMGGGGCLCRWVLSL